MDALLKKYKSKAEVSRVIGVTPEAVNNAFRRKTLPTTWLSTLINNGFTMHELLELPLHEEASQLLKTITTSYHMKRKSPKNTNQR